MRNSAAKPGLHDAPERPHSPPIPFRRNSKFSRSCGHGFKGDLNRQKKKDLLLEILQSEVILRISDHEKHQHDKDRNASGSHILL